MIVVVLIVRHVTAPLAALTQAADRIGRGEITEAIAEQGPEDVRHTMRAFNRMRERLERRFGAGVGRSVRLLYGGSVKPSNAAEIFDVPNVDGALVGGASLKAADFGGILAALDASPAEGG